MNCSARRQPVAVVPAGRPPDTQLHTWVGWTMTAIVVAGLVVGARAAATFAVEAVRFRRSDLGWFLSWHKALRTGPYEQRSAARA